MHQKSGNISWPVSDASSCHRVGCHTSENNRDQRRSARNDHGIHEILPDLIFSENILVAFCRKLTWNDHRRIGQNILPLSSKSFVMSQYTWKYDQNHRDDNDDHSVTGFPAKLPIIFSVIGALCFLFSHISALHFISHLQKSYRDQSHHAQIRSQEPLNIRNKFQSLFVNIVEAFPLRFPFRHSS